VRLIVGLGNPGRPLRWTRHNMGFCLAEALARRWGISLNSRGKKCIYGSGKFGEEEVCLAKPMTYMNLSGEAVRWLINFFHLALEDLLILHDDLDLPIGTIRLRLRGGHGGHQGIKSIIESLGSDNFCRLKMGIGRPADPQREIVDYLLSPLTEEERQAVEETREKAIEGVEMFLIAGPEQVMSKFHKKVKE